MAKISEDIIRLIESRAKIEDVVSDFIDLRKKGTRYIALCPFHDDHHFGNFSVYPRGNVYTCFACGAKGGPIEFVKRFTKWTFPEVIRWLGKKYCIEVDDVPFDYVPPPPPPPPPPLPTLVLPTNLVKQHMHTDDDVLCNWIRSIHWKREQAARVERVLKDYGVGHAKIRNSRHEFTLFWQIDKDKQVRTGHMMKYKPNGHRVKENEDDYATDWVHAILGRQNFTNLYDPEAQEMRQCLFGEHLLDKYPGAPVCIVESEKTALLMAIAYGNHALSLWMACCGVHNLTRERLAPLIKERRRIVLYPDRDGIEQWRKKAEDLHYDRLTIDTKAVKEWWLPQDGEKADIADVVVRIINGTQMVTFGELTLKNPSLKKLADKFKLQEER